MKPTYAVAFEKAPNNWCAYAPDVPGCVSTGGTWEEMLEMMGEALTFHVEGTLEDGDPLPEPKMSIDEAIKYHIEAISEADSGDDLGFDDDTPTVATRFELVEIEVRVPDPAQSSGASQSAPVSAR